MTTKRSHRLIIPHPVTHCQAHCANVGEADVVIHAPGWIEFHWNDITPILDIIQVVITTCKLVAEGTNNSTAATWDAPFGLITLCLILPHVLEINHVHESHKLPEDTSHKSHTLCVMSLEISGILAPICMSPCIFICLIPVLHLLYQHLTRMRWRSVSPMNVDALWTDCYNRLQHCLSLSPRSTSRQSGHIKGLIPPNACIHSNKAALVLVV